MLGWRYSYELCSQWRLHISTSGYVGEMRGVLTGRAGVVMATPSPAGDGSKTFTLASIMDESDDDLSDVELDAVGHPVISYHTIYIPLSRTCCLQNVFLV